MANIYQLETEIEETLDKYYELFDEDGVLIEGKETDLEELEKQLLDLQNKKSDYVDWLLKKRVNIIGDISGIQLEINRLNSLIEKSYSNLDKTDKFIEKITKPIYDGKPIAYGNFKVSFRKSESLIIDDESLISEDLKVFVPPTEGYFKTDKNVLKKALKDGVEIQGVHIEEKMNLQVK